MAQNETNHFLPFAFCTFVGDDHASRGCAVPRREEEELRERRVQEFRQVIEQGAATETAAVTGPGIFSRLLSLTGCGNAVLVSSG